MQKATTASKNSADAANKSAKAAEDSVNFAKETAQLDQRAWVNIQWLRLQTPLTPNAQAIVEMSVKNSGRTPAYNVKVRSNIYVGNDRIPLDENVPPVGRTSETTIGANADTPIGTKQQNILDQTAIDSIKHGESSLFTVGIITYRDVFGRQHRTDYCLFLERDNLDKNVFAAWGTGNTSD